MNKKNTNLKISELGLIQAMQEFNSIVDEKTDTEIYIRSCTSFSLELGESKTYVKPGEYNTVQVNVEPVISNAPELVWENLSPEILNLDNSGTILGLNEGTGTIKATNIETKEVQTLEITVSKTKPVPKNNEIWYTSSDGNIVEPSTSAFSANIISNTYKSGKGIIKFDGDVTEIGEEAFSGCLNLSTIEIPDSVTSIGRGAFNECYALSNISIPESVISIGDYCFNGCYLTLINFHCPESLDPEGNYYWGATIVDSEINGMCIVNNSLVHSRPWIINANIPSTVEKINDFAFKNNTNMITVSIPNTVNYIGEEAFCNCTSLSSINIPNSVTEILDGTFKYCSSLQNISIPDSVTSIGYNAFIGCIGLPTQDNIRYTSLNLSDNPYLVQNIDDSLSTYTIISGTKWIGSNAFSYCSSLVSIEIPESVTSIGNSAFYYCLSLVSIEIPDSVTSIGGSAFNGCAKLVSITIPDSVTNIGEEAFQSCLWLGSFTCLATTPPSLGYRAFSTANTYPIYVPAESVDTYKAATGWIEYASRIQAIS